VVAVFITRSLTKILAIDIGRLPWADGANPNRRSLMGRLAHPIR